MINLAFFTFPSAAQQAKLLSKLRQPEVLVTCNGRANYKERIETYYRGSFEDMWPERGHVGRAGGGRTNPKVKGLHGTYRNV